MFRAALRGLRVVCPGVGREVSGLAALAFVATGMEALVLVVVVAAAVGATGATQSLTFVLPVLGEVSVPVAAGLALAGAAALGSVAGRLVIAVRRARLQSEVFRSLRDRSIAAFQQASWARQSMEREGSLQETVSSLATRTAQLASQLADFVVGMLGFGALLLAALVVDVSITVVVVAAGLGLFGVLRPMTRITRERSRRFALGNAEFVETVSAWVSSAMDLRVFGVEGSAAAGLRARNAETADIQRRAVLTVQVGLDLYKELVLIGLVLAVAAVYVVGGVDLVALGVVVLLVVRSMAFGQQAQRGLQLVGEGLPHLEVAIERVGSLEADAAPRGSREVSALGRIEFRDVSYAYPDGRHGIDGVDVAIQPGEALGVVGPSGGGKSTLVQVLLRLRLPTSGSVVVGGVPYEEIDAADWHRLVSLVPQEPQLFEGTVFENVRFHRRWITTEAVRAAIEAAHLAADVAALPNGAETLLGPRGIGLSGGQKQRLAIARALAGRPELLVLDEPTSALDVRSEQLLRETIGELKGAVTLLIVTHRFTTLRSCDRVLVLDQGRPQLIGSLPEVMADAAFLRTPALPEDG